MISIEGRAGGLRARFRTGPSHHRIDACVVRSAVPYYVLRIISTWTTGRRAVASVAGCSSFYSSEEFQKDNAFERRQSRTALALARVTRRIRRHRDESRRHGFLLLRRARARDAQRDALLAAPHPPRRHHYAKLAAAAAARAPGTSASSAWLREGPCGRARVRQGRARFGGTSPGACSRRPTARTRRCGACFRFVGTVGAQIARAPPPAMRDAAAARGVDASWLRRLQLAGTLLESRVRRARPARNRHEPRGRRRRGGGRAGGVLLRPVRFASLARARAFSLRRRRHGSRGRRRGVARVPGARAGHERHIHSGREGAAFGRDARGRDARGSEGRQGQRGGFRRRRFRRRTAPGRPVSADLRVAWRYPHAHKQLVGRRRARRRRPCPEHSSGRACARRDGVAGSLTRIVPRLGAVPRFVLRRDIRSVVGMFELNNPIAVANPVEDYFLAATRWTARDTNAAATKRVTNLCWTRWTRVRPPCEGTGFRAAELLELGLHPNVAPRRRTPTTTGGARRDAGRARGRGAHHVLRGRVRGCRRAPRRAQGLRPVRVRAVRAGRGGSGGRRGGTTKWGCVGVSIA